jgi:hypothetical protein
MAGFLLSHKPLGITKAGRVRLGISTLNPHIDVGIYAAPQHQHPAVITVQPRHGLTRAQNKQHRGFRFRLDIRQPHRRTDQR